MIGCTVFNKIKVTQKNENILYIGTSKFCKTSYFQEQMEYVIYIVRVRVGSTDRARFRFRGVGVLKVLNIQIQQCTQNLSVRIRLDPSRFGSQIVGSNKIIRICRFEFGSDSVQVMSGPIFEKIPKHKRYPKIYEI